MKKIYIYPVSREFFFAMHWSYSSLWHCLRCWNRFVALGSYSVCSAYKVCVCGEEAARTHFANWSLCLLLFTAKMWLTWIPVHWPPLPSTRWWIGRNVGAAWCESPSPSLQPGSARGTAPTHASGYAGFHIDHHMDIYLENTQQRSSWGRQR